MIDEKKLIAEIREYIDEYKELDIQGMHNLKWCAMMEALELVERQPKVGEWIPCSERLPEDELDAEITYRGGMRGVGFYMGGYWRSTATGMAIDVIAWKEPSETWKGENE